MTVELPLDVRRRRKKWDNGHLIGHVCCPSGCSPWQRDPAGILRRPQRAVPVSPSIRRWKLLPWQRSTRRGNGDKSHGNVCVCVCVFSWACTCGGGRPPAPAGHSGSIFLRPSQLHSHRGEGFSILQLPFIKMSLTLSGTSGTTHSSSNVLQGA